VPEELDALAPVDPEAPVPVEDAPVEDAPVDDEPAPVDEPAPEPDAPLLVAPDPELVAEPPSDAPCCDDVVCPEPAAQAKRRAVPAAVTQDERTSTRISLILPMVKANGDE
jgi:hypothetical protein